LWHAISEVRFANDRACRLDSLTGSDPFEVDAARMALLRAGLAVMAVVHTDDGKVRRVGGFSTPIVASAPTFTSS